MSWLTISIQILFSIASTFPLVGAEASHQKATFTKKSVEKPTRSTQQYTLSAEETAESVARKFNLQVEELRELNLSRFPGGLNFLQQGDTLNVPQPTLAKNQNLPDLDSASVPQNDIQAQKLVSMARQAGSLLANHSGSDAATALALGSATSTINNSVQQWLSRNGNARVQLDIDKSFSLKNSQIDLLIPLHEQKNSLVFAQSSLHHTDDRIQSNLGMGLRWFDGDDYMLGANMFVDYDWSQHHVRAGTGIEYGRDFLKLGANGYRRLTDWKDAKEMTDYQSRPANGWDVSAEGWLPAWPQLGGKLIYEHYYGNEVALLNSEDRQKNPHAFSMGLNYTPIPLLTLSADHQFGYAGKRDTRLGLRFNYQLGVPWHQQINPDAVGAMHTLVGSRYALVERNNNIVLEYQKKESFQLEVEAPDQLRGVSGSKKTVSLIVHSTYGVANITPEAPKEVVIDKISNNTYEVTLPAYKPGSEDTNSYLITWTVTDKKGHQASSKTTVIVDFSEQDIDQQNSFVNPKKLRLSNVGVDSREILLTVLGRDDKPFDVDEKLVVGNIGSGKKTTISTFKRVEGKPGIYSAHLTPGRQIESFDVVYTVGGHKLVATTNVEIFGDKGIASMKLIGDKTVPSDKRDHEKIEILVTDRYNNPVKDWPISILLEGEDELSSIKRNWKGKAKPTDKNGKTTIIVNSLVDYSSFVGTATVKIAIDGFYNKSIDLRFIKNHSSNPLQ